MTKALKLAERSAAERDELANQFRNSLVEDIVPFWLHHGLDPECGGITTCLDRRGQVIDTDKGVWQQARFCWLLGTLYNRVEQRLEWLDAALNVANFIQQHCFDPRDGRMWFQVTREGKPLRKRRYAFGESFASIAFGQLAKATGDRNYEQLAVDCFEAFVQQMTDPVDPFPKTTDERPTLSLGFPMIALNTAQQLRESIGWSSANQWIDSSIERIQTMHLDESRQCVLETVSTDGSFIDHADGRTLNPGHAIEGAWFILWEARHRRDEGLKQLGCKMLDWMWHRGWDKEYGGLLYFVDADHRPVQEYWHDMKFWWPQNEGIIATLLAWTLTGDAKYAGWFDDIHGWSEELFPDKEYGEWFGYFHRDGRRSNELKGSLWKGPFHLPRMLLVCSELLSTKESDQ